LVIFFAAPQAAAGIPGASDVSAAIYYSLLFRLPGLFIIARLSGTADFFRFGRRDIGCFAPAFPAVFLCGFAVSLTARASGLFPAEPLLLPDGAANLAGAIFSAVTAAFLEEGYFRAYLIPRLQKAGAGVRESAAASVLLFALCHIYEGPWGALNAAAAGAVLSFFFIRYRSFYGVALAHALYNACAYAVMFLLR
jgi:membrane protease YdiL (CAAX protease family)